MNEQDINRINELSKIKKLRPLTKEEQEERALLHQRYIADIRASLSSHLDSIVIEHPNGTRVKAGRKGKNPHGS